MGDPHDLIQLVNHSTKRTAQDKSADSKRLGWKLQIIDGDNGPFIAKNLEMARNVIESVDGHCNPDVAPAMKQSLLRFIDPYQCGVDASSSRGGRLIDKIQHETVTKRYEMFDRPLTKKEKSGGGSSFFGL